MKLLKIILAILLGIIVTAASLVAATGVMWYILPSLQITVVGQFILKTFSETAILWITIGCSIGTLVFGILQRILILNMSAKFKNFFVHLNSWLLGILILGLAIMTFVLVNPLVANEVVISVPRKISIGIALVALVLFHIFSKKLSVIINRRIQAYENAKELNVVGRGSVIFTNLLKIFEIFFPELVVLLLLCFCVSWNIASYFITILVASVFPLLGNIECDFNTRREIRRKNAREKDELARNVAKHVKGE